MHDDRIQNKMGSFYHVGVHEKSGEGSVLVRTELGCVFASWDFWDMQGRVYVLCRRRLNPFGGRAGMPGVCMGTGSGTLVYGCYSFLIYLDLFIPKAADSALVS